MKHAYLGPFCGQFLVEYKSSIETDELNNTQPWLAQEICTGSAHAAVSEVRASALHKKAGEFDMCAIDAIKMQIVTF